MNSGWAVVHEILGQHLLEEARCPCCASSPRRGTEAHALVPDAPLDDLLQIRERAIRR